ncbi:hypothetical protein HDU85_004653 [Gaertneriomyces sp. JEL0708]|nr:hypothetical protein HDU85_004653 [Gaertneriomyces sp. JEL0708]
MATPKVLAVVSFNRALAVACLFILLLCDAILPSVYASTLPRVRVLLKPTVSIAVEDGILRPLVEAWSSQNNIEVTLDWAQSLITTDYSAIVNSYLKTWKPDYYDIYMLDVVWTGDYGPNFVPLDDLIPKAVFDSFNPDILVNNVVSGKHIALPWNANYGVFYYRTDLLAKYNHPVPETWDEMEAAARDILRGERALGDTSLAGYLPQLDSYEGLTCNIVEWIKSAGGGSIMDGEGHMTINNEAAQWILLKIAKWIDQDPWLIPTGSLVHQEQAGIDGFASGNAIFMRNWPKATKSIENSAAFDGTGRTWGFGPLPGRNPGQSGSALGGWQIGISNQTQDAASAAKVLAFLTSAEVQRARAVAHGLLPTIPELYHDAAVCTSIKHCDLYSNLQVAVRPSASVRSYLPVSQRIYTTVHDFLAGHSGFEHTQDGIQKMLAKLSVDVEKTAGTWVDPARGPPKYVVLSSPIAIVMMSLSVVGLLMHGATAIVLLMYRNVKTVKSASLGFCLLMILGSAVSLGTVFVYSGYPSETTCILQPWMLSLSFSVILLALLEKNWRVARIFNNPYMKRIRFRPYHFMVRAGAVLAVECAILLAWMIYDRPKPSRVYLATYNFATCQSSSGSFHWIMTGLLLALNGLLIFAAVAMAWFTRHIRSDYNEAHKIALVVWNTASFAFIALAILFIEGLSPTVVYVIRSLIILECNIFFLVVFFLPIFQKLFRQVNVRNADTSGKRTQSSASGSSDAESRPTDKGKTNGPQLPQQANASFCTGVLVGRYASSRFALGFAMWHQYTVVFHPHDGIVSFIPNDAKDGSGHTYRITSHVITAPVAEPNGLASFTLCFNQLHYFTFQLPTLESAAAWAEEFGKAKMLSRPRLASACLNASEGKAGEKRLASHVLM